MIRKIAQRFALCSKRMWCCCAVAGVLLSACTGVKAQPQSDWAHYDGDYQATRFASLDAITPNNVTKLGVACTILLGDDGPFQTGPLVIGRTLYVTTQNSTAAFDAATCAKHWVSRYMPQKGAPINPNRGAAFLDGRLFRGTLDGYLIALDASTGQQLWKSKAVDTRAGEFLSSAPIAWNGLVFIGSAGSDVGTRGRMMAFDAATGKRKWLFYTIPQGSATGADTWSNPRSTETGGGAMWTSYTLDPNSGELFVPVGNPAADWDGSNRPGSNLFTDSALVLDAKSGALRWWYQLVPHDLHDYDLGAPPALYTNAHGVAVMAAGGKDGYVHLVDRRTHKLLVKTAVTTLKNDTVAPTAAGIFTCPGALGGVEWFGPSVDQQRETLFTGSVDFCMTFHKGGVKDVPGVAFYGGSVKPAPDPSGWVTALDATTGHVRWKQHIAAPVVAGVTSTSGGVVFAGDLKGTFYAFDSDSGDKLASWSLPGAIAGGIVSYAVDGTQYVAVPSGNISRMTFGGAGSPTMTIFSLNATNNSVVDVRETPSTADAGGAQTFSTYCMGCHGAGGAGGGGGPSLKGEALRKNLAQTIQWIKNPAAPMPKLYPSPLSGTQVEAVAKYVQSL